VLLPIFSSQFFQHLSSKVFNYARLACVALLSILSLAILPLSSVSAEGGSTLAKVNQIRFADRQTNARIVLELSAPAEHQIFTLKNPDRVVLDIQSGHANGKLSNSRVAGTLIKSMRYAQKSDEKLRVVFDLNTAATPKSFLLAPSDGKGHRLVVDLTSATEVVQAEPVIAIEEKPTKLRNLIVAIDAGHGGKDPGAIGRAGTREKDIVLSISKRLKALIDKEKGMQAVLIRSGDSFVPLRGRIQKAHRVDADIFISIHADAAVNRKARGSSVYVLSQHGATSEAARILAKRENAVDKIGGVSLEDKDAMLKSVLVDLSQTATIDASIDLADDILGELSKVGKVLRGRVEQAGFAVLKSPDIPSVLVETAFISNPQEEKRLRSSKHQQALAQAILNGLRKYAKTHVPTEQLIASNVQRSTHTIKRGDTLSGIAIRYQVNIVDLRKINALRSDFLKVGQVLTIPASAGT